MVLCFLLKVKFILDFLKIASLPFALVWLFYLICDDPVFTLEYMML